jgi:hypothetical protein
VGSFRRNVEKVHKEDHVALGLLGFRQLDWHQQGDTFRDRVQYYN